MNEEKLYEIWKKYIDKPIYRAVPKKHIKNILKNGIVPGEDPHKEVHDEIKKLSRIIEKLEKKNFVMKFDWGVRFVSGSYAIKTTIIDFEEGYIDFTPNKNEAEYYLKLKGGALVSTIRQITNILINERTKLTKKELELVKFLRNWSDEKNCNNVMLSVKGSSKSFEKGLILPRIKKKNMAKRKKRKHLASFFGSFEHFKKVFLRNPEKYLKILEEGRFYIRLREKISANEIKIRKSN